MKTDIKKLFKEAKATEGFSLKKGHKARFSESLAQEMPKKRKNYWFYAAMAASFLLLISFGFYWSTSSKKVENSNPTLVETTKKPEEIPHISLSDLSPDLKKVEQYYLATINLELAQLDFSAENEELVKAYMEQLAVLNKEYQRLNKELTDIGPNDQTITALIQNLQFRLQLLQKLKEKLNELKESKNETTINI
ncbi:MAG: hypothetical protein NWQ38_14895 [Cellulophaga sp.]|nr:hypothetical protein [Cellulophaga sp.]